LLRFEAAALLEQGRGGFAFRELVSGKTVPKKPGRRFSSH